MWRMAVIRETLPVTVQASFAANDQVVQALEADGR